MRGRNEGTGNRRVTLGKILLLCCLLALAVTVLAVGFHAEQQRRGNERRQAVDEAELFGYVTLDGKTYAKKHDLTTLLFMGIDRETGYEPQNYRDGGQADMMILIVLDHQDKRIRLLQIDRDTMTDVVVVSVVGKRGDKQRMQLCLSHAFGRTDEERAAYTVEAVEDLLMGIDIDFYLAMNMDGVAAFNDVLGGVTMTIDEDLTMFDPAMRVGETLTLTGEQAHWYVRGRMSVGDGTNASRMRRQSRYLEAAGTKLKKLLSGNVGFADQLLDALDAHMTTNISRGRLINELNRAYRYQVDDVKQLEGTHTIGPDGFVEFWVEEDAIRSWLISELLGNQIK